MGILLITHNMGVVAEMADRVVVLKLGDVIETGETRELFARPQHPYTQQLLGAVPRMPGPEAVVSEEARPESAPVLAFEDVTIVYPGRLGSPAFTAVSSVSVDVRCGELLCLVGESGSGKTTLGRAAAGLVPVAGGRVVVEGEDLANVSRSRRCELRKDLAFVHQDPAASLDPRLTIVDSIREPLDVHQIGDRRSRTQRVHELLEAVRLPRDFASRLPHQLSGGQRQRVSLARALALEPRLVIADEPTSALDVSVQAEVLDLFTELQQRIGFACVFIDHDLAVVHKVADRVAVLREGRLVESGPIDRVFADPTHPYTRALINAVPVPDPEQRREPRLLVR